MGWHDGANVSTGDLITAAIWNNYMGASGSLEYLKARHEITSYRDTLTSDYNLTTSEADTGLSISVPVASGYKVLLFFSADFIWVGIGYLAYFKLYRDAVQIKGRTIYGPGQAGDGVVYYAAGIITLDTPEAATYTYKIRANGSAGSTGKIDASANWPAELTAIVF